jgi:CelD/BcsL family acetyltransferase involved in cellulose biosynthesis
VLSLPATVAGLEEVIPGRQRYNLRQYRRRALRAGTLEIAEADDRGVSKTAESWERDPRWKEMLVALAHLHRARWGGGSVRWAFHRQLIPGFLARGALAMYGLRLDGRLAAVHYGFYEQGTAYCYLHAFDAAWEKLSPGALLLGGVIEAAVERGARAFDFGRGRETYKYHWGARDRESRRRQLRPDR